MIHAAACHLCNDGNGVGAPPQREHWRGAYATRGGTIDAALSTGLAVRECDCIRGRVNLTGVI